MNLLVIFALVVGGVGGWTLIMRNWRMAIYLLFCFTPVTGLVVAAMQPSPLGNLARDIMIIIPLYIAYMLTKRPTDRAFVPFSVLAAAFALSVVVILQVAIRSADNPALGVLGAKIWLMYIPLIIVGGAFLSSQKDLRYALRTIVITSWLPFVVGIMMWAGAIAYDYRESVELLYGEFARNATQGFVQLKVGETTFYRIPSTFQFVSQYSAFCQFMIFPILMLIRVDTGRRWRIFGYVTLVLAIVAALTCGSRGVFLYLPVMFIILAGLRIGAKGKPSLAIALVLLVVSAIAALYFDQSAIYDNIADLTEHYGQGLVVGGLEYAVENGGFWGLGPGTAAIASRYVIDPSLTNTLFSNAVENYYAKSWTELGAIGFVADVSLLVSIAVTGLLTVSRIRDPKLKDCGIAALAMALYLMFISTRGLPLDQDPFAYYYYLFVGFMFKLPYLAGQPVTKPVQNRRWAGPLRRPIQNPGVRTHRP
ncbi:MAG: O-antigen ligase family protein [Rhodospirillales bacterium]